MCSFLTPNIVLKIILDALFEFKSKGKYERKMLNRLKRNFKRKIYINSFRLMSQVYFWRGDYYKNCLPLQNPGQLPAAEVNFEDCFSDVFKGLRKGALGTNGLRWQDILLSCANAGTGHVKLRICVHFSGRDDEVW